MNERLRYEVPIANAAMPPLGGVSDSVLVKFSPLAVIL